MTVCESATPACRVDRSTVRPTKQPTRWREIIFYVVVLRHLQKHVWCAYGMAFSRHSSGCWHKAQACTASHHVLCICFAVCWAACFVCEFVCLYIVCCRSLDPGTANFGTATALQSPELQSLEHTQPDDGVMMMAQYALSTVSTLCLAPRQRRTRVGSTAHEIYVFGWPCLACVVCK